MDKKDTAVNPVGFYELEKVKFLIKDAVGLDIAYAYEDLVFAEHGILILQFVDTDTKSLNCWFNRDCIEGDRLSMLESLTKTATLNKIKVTFKGFFEMIQKDGKEQIDIKFIDSK